MLKISRLAVLLAAGTLVSGTALAADAKSVATVNGQPISQNTYQAFLSEQLAQGAPDSAELKNAVREELIRREIIAQEAKKKGLDKNGMVQGQIELARQAVLIRSFVNDHLKSHPISDASLKAEYDRIKSSLGSTEYKARHILVDNEADAKAIIAKLNKGEKIADLAKQSKDPGSRDKGGELDWSSPNAYVKPFADALVALKKGEYTKDPIKSDFGYHVIQLEDSRPLNPPPFEQLKPQLQQRATQVEVEKMVKELRAKAKVN